MDTVFLCFLPAILHCLSRFAFMALTIFSLQAHGQVWVSHKSIDPVEFESFLDLKQELSFVDHYEQFFPSQKEEESLRQDFLQAQRTHLTKNWEKARHLFQSVAQKALGNDWKLTEREIILYSFFRWAELTANESEKAKILRQAYQFDPTVHPETDLFSPELCKIYERIKNEQAQESFLWSPTRNKEMVSSFEIIKVNGRRYPSSLMLRIEIPPGVHRVTWLSNRFLPQTQLIHQDNIAASTYSKRPLLEGTCERAEISTSIALTASRWGGYFSEDCQWISEKSSTVTKSEETRKKVTMDSQPTQTSVSADVGGSSQNYIVKNWPLWTLLGAGLWLIYDSNNQPPPAAPRPSSTARPFHR